MRVLNQPWPIACHRAALFLAAAAPMSVWLFSGTRPVHSGQALAWALCCATLLAAVPGRAVRISFWTQTAALPLSLGWMGSVAVTGYGPSNAALNALGAGAVLELAAALRLAITHPAFLAAFLLTVTALTLAWITTPWITTQKVSGKSQNTAGVLFLCTLLPAASANMNGTLVQSLPAIAAPEVRNTVVWFSHLEMAKEVLSQALDIMALGDTLHTSNIRSAHNAHHLFQATDGLAIFIAGESLRADALLVEGRGPWSAALSKRLKQGLGIRLGDACAGGNATFTSLPRLLTAVDPSDTAGAAEKPTILALAKAGGAKTAYIMNHES